MATETRLLSKRTLTTQLEAALRAEIVSGELKPGARLRAEELAVRYGVSHTPIREALRSLAADSLISIDPHTGAQVANVSVDDLRDVYRVRLLLEPEALRGSIALGDEAWAHGVVAALDRLSAAFGRRAAKAAEGAAERAAAHRSFDEALFAACGSPWLLRLVRTISAHSERYRAVLRSVTTSADRDVESEHRNIAMAALDRDTHSATEALEVHLRRSLELTKRHLTAAREGGHDGA